MFGLDVLRAIVWRYESKSVTQRGAQRSVHRSACEASPKGRLRCPAIAFEAAVGRVGYTQIAVSHVARVRPFAPIPLRAGHRSGAPPPPWRGLLSAGKPAPDGSAPLASPDLPAQPADNSQAPSDNPSVLIAESPVASTQHHTSDSDE